MRFFTSDLHLGHANIIGYCDRPFRDVDHMNRELITNWNYMVGFRDDVYIVGDFAMGHRHETVPLARELNGNKFLIPGNHDYVGPFGKKGGYELYEASGFTILEPHILMHLMGEEDDPDAYISLCHFPYQADNRHDDKYNAWLPKDLGRPLLHGHIHGKRPNHKPRQYDVGVDANNYMPVPETTIKGWILNGATES